MIIPSISIFKEAVAIYKTNYKIFLKIISWFLGAAVLVIILNIIDRQTAFKYVNYTFPIYLILTAISFIIGLWTQIVLIRLINAGLNKEMVEKTTLGQNAWRDTVPFLWVSILTGLIILGGTFLLIIPGLIFSIWYSFSVYVYAIEGNDGYSALQKSKDLVQGRFWLVVWKLIGVNLLYGLVLVVFVALPTLIIGYFTKFAEFTPNFASGPWWSDALQSIVTILTLPISIALWVILYKNLKENPVTTTTNIQPPTI